MPNQEPQASLHAVVRGRVQGVGFRDFVITRGRALGLTGYVRNLPDGRSIEVVAEGDRPQLDRLLAHLSEGPRGAQVQAVEKHWGLKTGLYTEFGARL